MVIDAENELSLIKQPASNVIYKVTCSKRINISMKCSFFEGLEVSIDLRYFGNVFVSTLHALQSHLIDKREKCSGHWCSNSVYK